jgi:hypothetical protein
MKRLATALLFVNLLACGTGDSVSGSVQGHSLAARDGIFGQGSVTVAGTSLYSMVVTITDYPSACASEQATASQGVLKADATTLTMLVGADSPIASGEYSVTSPTGATPPILSATFSQTNAQCSSVLDGGLIAATSGSVTFTTVSASKVAGAFTLSFGSDQLTGSFNTSPCGASFGDGGTTLTCG